MLELGKLPIADLGRLLEVALAFHLAPLRLELLLQVADGVDGVLLRLPVRLHGGRLLLEVRQLLVQRGQPLLGHDVGFLGQRHALDLQLTDPALDDVDLRRHRVDLDAQLAGRFVHQVDGLVGQEASGQVSVGQYGRGHQGGVLDAYPVVDLVALLEPTQDGNGVFDRGLADEHLLEPPLEGRVLLDVFAVLVESGGPDHAQLAARQHGLEHVAGVHRTLPAGPGADDGVHLIDERDDFAVAVGDLLEHGLEPLFELAAVLGASHHAR